MSKTIMAIPPVVRILPPDGSNERRYVQLEGFAIGLYHALHYAASIELLEPNLKPYGETPWGRKRLRKTFVPYQIDCIKYTKRLLSQLITAKYLDDNFEKVEDDGGDVLFRFNDKKDVSNIALDLFQMSGRASELVQFISKSYIGPVRRMEFEHRLGQIAPKYMIPESRCKSLGYRHIPTRLEKDVYFKCFWDGAIRDVLARIDLPPILPMRNSAPTLG